MWFHEAGYFHGIGKPHHGVGSERLLVVVASICVHTANLSHDAVAKERFLHGSEKIGGPLLPLLVSSLDQS